MVAGGWQRGHADKYDRALALYPEDMVGFVQHTQPEQWDKFCGLITDHLTQQDLVNYAYTVRDTVRENEKVMSQLDNNSDEQALLGDFPKAVDDAILDSSDAHGG